MRLIKPVIVCLVLAGTQLAAHASFAEDESEDRGEHHSGLDSDYRGPGGGAPAPLLGLTLLGQATGVAGIFAAWRKRRPKPNSDLRCH